MIVYELDISKQKNGVKKKAYEKADEIIKERGTADVYYVAGVRDALGIFCRVFDVDLPDVIRVPEPPTTVFRDPLD